MIKSVFQHNHNARQSPEDGLIREGFEKYFLRKPLNNGPEAGNKLKTYLLRGGGGRVKQSVENSTLFFFQTFPNTLREGQLY